MRKPRGEVPAVAPESVEAKRLLLALPTWTDDETAFFFGMSRDQLAKWRRAEKLDCYAKKIGEVRLWDARALRSLLQVVPEGAYAK